jgi:hypothetical protein
MRLSRRGAVAAASGEDGPAVLRAFDSDSGTTTATVAKPAGTVDGDLIVSLVWLDFADADLKTITAPSGHTLESSAADPGSDTLLAVYSKTASSEPATWDWTYTTGSGGTVVVVTLVFEGATTISSAGVAVQNNSSVGFAGTGPEYVVVGGFVPDSNNAGPGNIPLDWGLLVSDTQWKVAVRSFAEGASDADFADWDGNQDPQNISVVTVDLVS